MSLARNLSKFKPSSSGLIETADIADNAITTAKITDANITTAKIADTAVTTAKITDANITTAKVADDGITNAKIGAGAVTNTEINSSAGIVSSKLGTIGADKMPSGSVIQTVSLVHTTLFSTTTSNAFVDITNLSLSITPTNASNKILVRMSLACGHENNSAMNIRLLRGSTSIGSQSNNASAQYDSIVINMRGINTHHISTQTCEILDSPNTTSAITYKPQLIANHNITSCINRSTAQENQTYASPPQSGIILQEIKG